MGNPNSAYVYAMASLIRLKSIDEARDPINEIKNIDERFEANLKLSYSENIDDLEEEIKKYKTAICEIPRGRDRFYFNAGRAMNDALYDADEQGCDAVTAAWSGLLNFQKLVGISNPLSCSQRK